MCLMPFVLDLVSPLVKASLRCISLKMLILILGSLYVIFWVLGPLLSLENT